MAKKVKANNYQSFNNSALVRAMLGVILLAAAYGFASWAIDAGALWMYALAVIFIVWGIKEIVQAAKKLMRSKGNEH